MEMRFCQSCGMPMRDTDELYGTNADGSNRSLYSIYAGSEQRDECRRSKSRNERVFQSLKRW